ncbi:hypothetical protein QLH52_11860 [Methylomonas sp. OY6]|uniref:Uncharacterized protein n=1 Tax=Methylomonas defluvii TaxID=3045149 RepID=A0ABU4UF42_9GAMM|nr:hypothetical protein [Methylomonas sp. OY6]MDX8127980.1 hypothetical protein [Methylomonas sp. OY6]
MKITKIQQAEDDIVGKTLDHIVDSHYAPSAKAKMRSDILITYKCLINLKELDLDILFAIFNSFLQDLKNEADDRFALDVVDYDLKTIGLKNIAFDGDDYRFEFDSKENHDRYSPILLHVAAVLYCTSARTFLDSLQSDQTIH